MRARYQDTVIAESVSPVKLATEWYVPAEAVYKEYLRANGGIRYCHWKGEADVFDVVIGDAVFRDAAWCLARPFWEAMDAKGMYAFDPKIIQIDGV